MRSMIASFAKTHGLLWGIASAEPFEELREPLLQGNAHLAGFAEQDIEKRIDPAQTLADVKSIVVLAIGYHKKAPPLPEGMYGRVSVGAVGLDYHTILMNHLLALAECMQNAAPKSHILPFVDTGPLSDRHVALRAGIGYLGKNGCIHSPELGSMIFLGYLLTDILLLPTERQGGSCGTCRLCQTLCPGGALTAEGFFLHRCVSYLTQTKDVLLHADMRRMGSQLYGCDVCQVVCPHNRAALETAPLAESSIFFLPELLTMSNRAFREGLGSTAAGWRGRKVWQRNALIALGNSGQRDALPHLQQALSDPRPMIQETARRSIENLIE